MKAYDKDVVECFLILIGEFIALNGVDVSIKYLTNYALADKLFVALQKGNLQMRNKAIWIL